MQSGTWPAAPVSPEQADAASTFLKWAWPFMEGCLWVNKRYRTVGDQDEALLFLTAWHFLMADIANSQELLGSVGNLPVRAGLARLAPERFRPSSIASFIEETGIPRETARRKLAALVARGVFVTNNDGTYQLATLDEVILDVIVPAFGLARWMASINGWPPATLGQPVSVRSHGGLIRHYLAAYLAMVKARRIHTGRVSQVPVQMAIMLLQTMKVERKLKLEGPANASDFQTYVALSLPLLDEPYYLCQIAHLCDLPLDSVRTSCRQLDEDNGLVTRDGSEALRIGGLQLSTDTVGSRRFYSLEIQQRVSQFTKHVLARAERLSRRASTPKDVR